MSDLKILLGVINEASRNDNVDGFLEAVGAQAAGIVGRPAAQRIVELGPYASLEQLLETNPDLNLQKMASLAEAIAERLDEPPPTEIIGFPDFIIRNFPALRSDAPIPVAVPIPDGSRLRGIPITHFANLPRFDGAVTADEAQLEKYLILADGLHEIAAALLTDSLERVSAKLRDAGAAAQKLSTEWPAFSYVSAEFAALADAIETRGEHVRLQVFRSLCSLPPASMFGEIFSPEAAETYAALVENSTRLSGHLKDLEKIDTVVERTTLSRFSDALANSESRLIATNRLVLGLRGEQILNANAVKVAEQLFVISESVELLASSLALLPSFRVCPADECEEAGVLSCELKELRALPVVRIGTGRIEPWTGNSLDRAIDSEFVRNLIEQIKRFFRDGEIPPAALDALKALFAGAGFREIFKNYLKGKIPIGVLVDWLVTRIAAILGTHAGATLAAGLAAGVAASLMALTIASFALDAITHVLPGTLLFCATFTVDLCIAGYCHKYRKTIEIKIKITPRSIEMDGGMPGIFGMVFGAQELGAKVEDVLRVSKLLELIAEARKRRQEAARRGEQTEVAKIDEEIARYEDRLRELAQAKAAFDRVVEAVGRIGCRSIRSSGSLPAVDGFEPC